jgi:hypothetical protein
MKIKKVWAKWALAVAMSLGAVGQASAQFIGDDSATGECFANVRPVFHHYYFFWVEVHESTTYEAC